MKQQEKIASSFGGNKIHLLAQCPFIWAIHLRDSVLCTAGAVCCGGGEAFRWEMCEGSGGEGGRGGGVGGGGGLSDLRTPGYPWQSLENCSAIPAETYSINKWFLGWKILGLKSMTFVFNRQRASTLNFGKIGGTQLFYFFFSFSFMARWFLQLNRCV